MAAGYIVATVQLLQRGPRADAAGQVFGLALGHRTLQAGAVFDACALKVIGGKLGGVEGTADQLRTGDRMGQGPVVLEWGAAGGESVHGRYCASR